MYPIAGLEYSSPANARADACQRRLIVQRDPLPVGAYSKLRPQTRQVHGDWLRSHLLIELPERTAARCFVADLERALEGPVRLDRTTSAIDSSKSIPNTLRIAGPLPAFNVCRQAQQRTAPVASSPCAPVVKS